MTMATAMVCTCREKPTRPGTRTFAGDSAATASPQAYVPGQSQIHAGVNPVALRPGDTTGLVEERIPTNSPLLRELGIRSPALTTESLFVSAPASNIPWEEGRPIDTTFYGFFGGYYSVLQALSKGIPSLFIIGKIDVDTDRVGFLIRAPDADFSPEAVDLWLFDIRGEHFLAPLRLASAWGDEGYETNLESWLLRDKSGFRIFQRRWAASTDSGAALPRDSLLVWAVGGSRLEVRGDSLSLARARAFFYK